MMMTCSMLLPQSGIKKVHHGIE